MLVLPVGFVLVRESPAVTRAAVATVVKRCCLLRGKLSGEGTKGGEANEVSVGDPGGEDHACTAVGLFDVCLSAGCEEGEGDGKGRTEIVLAP